MQEEISLRELFELLKKHALKFVVAIIIGVMFALIGMFLFAKPKYGSETQLLVNQQQQGTVHMIQYNEIQSNIQLINTYRDIITGQSVLEQVNESMGGNYSTEQLKRAVTISQSPNSQAFFIRAVMSSPEEAQQVVSSVLTAFESTVKEAYGQDVTNIYVVSPPSYNPRKVSPSTTRFALIGAALAVLATGLFVVLVEGLDNTVRTEEYVSQLGLINLGSIQELSEHDLQKMRSNGEGRRIIRRRKVS